MAYIGNAPPPFITAVAVDVFSGNASNTAFTLSKAVTKTSDIEVVVDNIQQNPFSGSYSVSGATLTFSSAPSASSNNIVVAYRQATVALTAAAANSVSSSSLQPNSVSSSSLQPNSVSSSSLQPDLSLTGNVTMAGTLTTASRSIAKASMPAGSVLQVVNANLTTVASTASTTAVTTGLTATITPTSSTSKILVIVNGIGSHSEVGSNQGVFRMVRNIPSANTVIDNQSTSPGVSGVSAAVVEGARTRNPVDFSLYDSPATASAITYTLQFFTSGGGTVYLGRWGTDANWLQSTNLTLMEIAA
jgi:hypothetical protein